MIVYTQPQTLARDLGTPVHTLYALANTARRHYRRVELPKKDGGVRTLHIPDEPLKRVQRAILDTLLAPMDVSPCAAAYRIGCDAARGARVHAGQKTLLCLDILDFFGHIRYCDVKRFAFPKERYAPSLRVLLSQLCYLDESLPQGAPTSPAISNLVLYDFDMQMLRFCAPLGVRYTRYCDDLSFSGDFDAHLIYDAAKQALLAHGFVLNEKKTRLLTQAQRQCVTGLVVNERVRVPRKTRDALRQELYYCQKFGVESHLLRSGCRQEPKAYCAQLLGRLNWALRFEKEDAQLSSARAYLAEQIKRLDAQKTARTTEPNAGESSETRLIGRADV